VEGAKRVLDIGCGDGKITTEIAARDPRGSVLGDDPSQNMIAFRNDGLAEVAAPVSRDRRVVRDGARVALP
jgi:trans-aconitate 2-methyltransferase